MTILAALFAALFASTRAADHTFFGYPSGPQFEQQILDLRGNFSTVRAASSLYGVPPSEHGSVKCSPSIISVTDVASVDGDFLRPQLFISGEIHGNERVGPLAALHSARLLSLSAACEVHRDPSACSALEPYALDGTQRVWLALLATRRETLISPITNCLGYHLTRRDDNGVDPNRDFPYVRRDTNCFMSSTSRIINGILLNSLTQLVVTFHGGMAAIGYEWGSFNHMRPADKSPDEHMNRDVASAMSRVGGGFRGEKEYRTGTINSLVYPVYGGMEDWIYAAGWDRAGVQQQCKGLPRNQRTAQAQAAVFLVETSDLKSPPGRELGCETGVLSNSHLPILPKVGHGVSFNDGSMHAGKRDSSCDGHVQRNIRLALSAVDMVQPYICLSNVNIPNFGSSALRGAHSLQVSWFVGGSQHVDRTWVSLHHSPLRERHQRDQKSDIDVSYLKKHSSNWTHILDLLSAAEDPRHLSTKHLRRTYPRRATGTGREQHLDSPSAVWSSPELSGHTIWSNSHYSPGAAAPGFVTNVNIPRIRGPRPLLEEVGDAVNITHVYWMVAWAAVDSHWGQPPGVGRPANTDPKSFLAKARSTPEWTKVQNKEDVGVLESGDRIPREIRGRKYWPSDPSVLEVTYHYSSAADPIIADVRVSSLVTGCAWWTR